jgi:hypothetical protein
VIGPLIVAAGPGGAAARAGGLKGTVVVVAFDVEECEDEQAASINAAATTMYAERLILRSLARTDEVGQPASVS